MDGFSFFNVGFSELLFILVFAGLVMGPQRIRVVARWLGQATAKLRGISSQFMQQLNNELDGSEREDLKAALEDIQGLRKEMQDLRRELYTAPKKDFDKDQKSFRQEMDELKKGLSLNGGTTSGSTDNGTSAPAVNGQANTIENSMSLPSIALPSAIEIDDDLE